MDKTYEVWKELRERLSQGDLFKIIDLQGEIASLKTRRSLCHKVFHRIEGTMG